MYGLKIIRERKQNYGSVRRVRDAAQVYDFRQAGDLVGTRVLDHVVVGDGSFVSMAEREGGQR